MRNALYLMLSVLALALLSAGVGIVGANLATGRGIFDAPPHCPSYKEAPEEIAQEEPPSRVECIPCAGEGFICGKVCRNCNGYGTVKRHGADLTLYPEKDPEPDCQVKILSSLPRK